jgi:aminoglycoside phosphotransferase (APT) family kinase protein
MRTHLLGFAPLPPALIHGDVHPGNVMVRRRGGKDVPVLLDWGRARIGSPLEDVTSWLQSLSYWEPLAMRRHDTLLAEYLVARRAPTGRDADLRRAYWLAAASNVLAGALRYHVHMSVSEEAGTAGRAAAALRAARDALRIIRRADAWWRAT